MFDFSRAEHHRWRGFCQGFWNTNQECLRRRKSLDFQGCRILIFFQNLCSLDKFHKGISNALEPVYVGAYRQFSEISKWGSIRSAYGLPVFRCPEKQPKATSIINPLKWPWPTLDFWGLSKQSPEKALQIVPLKKIQGWAFLLIESIV